MNFECVTEGNFEGESVNMRCDYLYRLGELEYKVLITEREKIRLLNDYNLDSANEDTDSVSSSSSLNVIYDTFIFSKVYEVTLDFMSTIFLQSSGFSAFNTGIEWNGNSRIKLEEISERFVLMYVEGWWVVDLEYFVILPFKNTNTDMTYDNNFYINESAITIGVAVNSEIVLTESDELDTVIWCCHNRVEDVEIIIPDEIILKTFKESIEEKRWKVLEGVGERIEWEYWEEVITNNVDRKVVEIAGKVGGEEKVVKRLVEVGCGVEEILRLTEGGERGKERVVNFYLGEREWQEIEWEEKVRRGDDESIVVLL